MTIETLNGSKILGNKQKHMKMKWRYLLNYKCDEFFFVNHGRL
jgi:hypothetical protein